MTLLNYFFGLTSIHRLGQKYKSIFVHFLVQIKTFKSPFENQLTFKVPESIEAQIEEPIAYELKTEKPLEGKIQIPYDPKKLSPQEEPTLCGLFGFSLINSNHLKIVRWVPPLKKSST